MSTVTELDPFTQVYDTLWDMLERNACLAQLIKIGNREKYRSWIGEKLDVSSADLPEIAIVEEDGTFNFQSTSSHSSITVNYSYIITTGDLKICSLNEILWEVMRCGVDWDIYLCGLTWKDSQVVRNANQGSFSMGTLDTGRNRGIRGWSSLCSLQVDFMIPTSLMRIQ